MRLKLMLNFRKHKQKISNSVKKAPRILRGAFLNLHFHDISVFYVYNVRTTTPSLSPPWQGGD